MVIRSSGLKPDGDLENEPTEAELRFDYGTAMNAAIYTQGDEAILRLKPMVGAGLRLQEVQIEGTKVTDGDGNTIEADTILRIAAKGDSDAALTFAKEDTSNTAPSRYGIDIAKIYRPANYDYLKVEPGEKLEVEGDILLPKTGTADESSYPVYKYPSYDLKFTGSYYDGGNTWEEVETAYTLRNDANGLAIFYYDNYGGVTSEEESLLRLDSMGNLWIKGSYLNIASYSTTEDNSIRLSTSQYTSSYFNGSLGIGRTKAENKLHVNGAINLDPIAEPAAPSTGFVLYVDSDDGNLKAKASTGAITVLAQD